MYDAPADDDTDEALAKFGLRLDNECRRDTTIWVWPQNEKSVALFHAAVVRRCWRFSFSGPVALDEKLVRREAMRLGIKVSARRWNDLLVMEGEALEQMARLRDRQG
jgi:hypothetical protein